MGTTVTTGRGLRDRHADPARAETSGAYIKFSRDSDRQVFIAGLLVPRVTASRPAPSKLKKNPQKDQVDPQFKDSALRFKIQLLKAGQQNPDIKNPELNHLRDDQQLLNM